jgi:hypothetical protein
VLSERTLLLAGVLGLVPGVAAAVWWGWGGNVLKIAGLVSAVLVMGVLYLVDRVLVRQRDAAKAPPKGDW